MKRLIHHTELYVVVFLATQIVACAQRVVAPPAPDVISRIASAKHVFLSNAGEDSYFVNDIPGGADISYNELYTSLKQWGRFQLADSPSKADLIFEVRGTEACTWNPKGNITNNRYTQVCSAPMLNLSILDPSTQDLLYKIVMPAGRASNIPKGKIAFSQSIDTLTDKIKALVAAPAPPQNP
jgi:hypothetical protein